MAEITITLTKAEYDELMKKSDASIMAAGGGGKQMVSSPVPVHVPPPPAAGGGGGKHMVSSPASVHVPRPPAAGGGEQMSPIGPPPAISTYSRSVAIQKVDATVPTDEEINNIMKWIYSHIPISNIESIVKLTKGNLLFVNFVDNKIPASILLQHKTFIIKDIVYTVNASKNRPIPIDILSAMDSSKRNGSLPPSPILYLGFGSCSVDDSTITSVFSELGVVTYQIISKEKNGNYYAFVTTNSIRTTMTLNQKKDLLREKFAIPDGQFQIGYGKEPVTESCKLVTKKTFDKPPLVVDTTNMTTIYIGCSTIAVTPEQIATELSVYQIPIKNIYIRKINHYSNKTLYEAYVLTDSYESVKKVIDHKDDLADQLKIGKKFFRIGSKETKMVAAKD